MFNVAATLVALVLAALALGWTPSVDWAKAQWAFLAKGFTELATGKTDEAHGAFVVKEMWLLFRRAVGVLAVIALLAALLASPAGYRPDGSRQSLYEAIVAFQIEHGLTGDGLWGPKTHDAYRKGA
jgi:hypothetical protein